MANRKLTWEFALLDKISGPAGTEAKALSKLKISLEGAGGGLERLAQRKDHANRRGESLATTLHSVIGVGEKVGHMALATAEGVFHLGETFSDAAVEAAAFKETTLVGLETIMGSATDAQKVLRDTVRLSYNLPIETGAAVEAATQLALAGVPKEDLNHLTIAASDVKAFNPGRGDEALRLFLRQVADIQAVGLNARHLLALAQETHIPEDKIIGNLAKFSGQKAPNKAHGMELAKFLEEIPKDTALTAITQTIADLQGGQLGTISKRLATTVDGMKSTLHGRPLELMMDLDSNPAYAEFKGFLANAVKLTDPGSAFGSKIKDTIGQVFGGTFHRLFADFSGDDGLKNLEQVFDQVLHGVQLVGASFEVGAGFVNGFLKGLAGIGGVSDGLFGKDGKIDQKKIDEVAATFGEMGKSIGIAAVELGKLAKTGAELGETPLLKLIRGDYGSQAADWLYDKTHPHMGQGYMMGLDKKGPRGGFISPITPILPPGGEEIDRLAGARSTTAGGGGMPLGRGGDVSVVVHAPGATPGAAQAIGSELERVVPSAVAKANRNLTLQPARP